MTDSLCLQNSWMSVVLFSKNEFLVQAESKISDTLLSFITDAVGFVYHVVCRILSVSPKYNKQRSHFD